MAGANKLGRGETTTVNSVTTTNIVTYTVGNFAPAGSTTKDACLNTQSTCPNVPMGAEMLLDQYLTCGASCVRSCKAKEEMLTGTCTDAGTGTVCKACSGTCRMDMTVTFTLYVCVVVRVCGRV